MPQWRFVARGLLPALSVGLLLSFADGCSKRKPEQPKPVGDRDPRIREVTPVLTEWIGLWQAAIPGFRAESLYFGGEVGGALRGGYVQPLRNVYPPAKGEEATFAVLTANSPDGRYKLVFDWYQYVGESDGEIDIGGEPDSAPLLLDLREGVSNQFLSCGTPCGYHWGAWVSSTKFALGGWMELDPAGNQYRGTLRVYSIPDSTVASYATRTISSEAFFRYKSGWESWVASRYRALKRQARG